MKEQFISKIEEVLFGYGFSKKDNTYERIQTLTQPGQVMIINGRQMKQPDQHVEVKHVVKEVGDGYISNMDDTNKVDLTTYEFLVYVNGQEQGAMSIAYRWDDAEDFKINLSNIIQA